MTNHALLYDRRLSADRPTRLTVDDQIAVHRAELRLSERALRESRRGRRRGRLSGLLISVGRLPGAVGSKLAVARH